MAHCGTAELRLKAFGSTVAKPSLSRDNPKKKAVSRDDGLAERDDEALYPGNRSIPVPPSCDS